MSIFPFLQPQQAESTISDYEVYRDVLWDYDAGKPVFLDGAPVMTEGLKL